MSVRGCGRPSDTWHVPRVRGLLALDGRRFRPSESTHGAVARDNRGTRARVCRRVPRGGARDHRDVCGRTGRSGAGVPEELHALRRDRRRGTRFDGSRGTRAIAVLAGSPGDHDRFTGLFQAPTEAEIAAKHLPAPPTGHRSWLAWAANRWPSLPDFSDDPQATWPHPSAPQPVAGLRSTPARPSPRIALSGRVFHEHDRGHGERTRRRVCGARGVHRARPAMHEPSACLPWEEEDTP